MADFANTSTPSSAFLKRKIYVRTSRASPDISNGEPPYTPEILAPTPQRHLLESNVRQSWLRTPPLSPVSSRAISPTSTRALSKSPQLQKSFNSLLDHESSEHGATHTFPRMHSTEGLGPRPKTVEGSMARRFVRWTHRQGRRNWALLFVFLVSVLVKYCIGLGSYSGQGTPPMYGDYEAQRHWMELTIHLPTRQWYTYDLQYWGLDYPPLTAYHSWLCGLIGSRFNPDWFALKHSRGIETEGSKVFMRSTVVVSDALIYIPALFIFSRTWLGTRSKRTQNLAFIVMAFQPALLLVDFGHFQYNSVMLGFTILSISLFAISHDVLGAVAFVCSLGFKQMALYYAPAIGTYLLAKCLLLGPVDGGRLFIRIAVTTILAFTLLFLPFLPPFAPLYSTTSCNQTESPDCTVSYLTILDPISRVFPFARGLFEDKVANFWCASNVLIKWRAWASPDLLLKASAAFTLIGFLPGVLSMLGAGWKMRTWGSTSSSESPSASTPTPILSLLPYALLNSSMSFFLFSFQVHEKTILLPLMPMMLLSSGAVTESTTFAWGALVTNAAVFSMWPLLKRDGLGLQYFVLLVAWNRLIGYNPFKQPTFSLKSFVQLLAISVHTAAILLHICELLFNAPARYPDLFPVLNVLISTPVFVCTWLWSIKCCIEASWALGGLAGSGSSSSSTAGARPSSRAASIMSAGDEDVNMRDKPEGSLRGDRARTASLGFAHTKQRTRSSVSFSRASGVRAMSTEIT
ncbi:Glucosyltransferase-like protein [Stygiomarasmius scandens]|uniref:Alpha-1,3-glucosyltransferase n=1 Tax=Marasmiellus scandens TaxID=2682957 RepID=A0ABR1JZT5_9AGAR